MHERSLVWSLLRQLEDLMREHEADRVVAVRVGVGQLAGVDPDLFQSAYEELVEQTPVRGAELRATAIAVELQCSDCGSRSELVGFRFLCPLCGSGRVVVLRGEGVILESVTLEPARESSRAGWSGADPAGGPMVGPLPDPGRPGRDPVDALPANPLGSQGDE
ncbi:MAG: hydrogenase maturation nickel metallochaperone HypA [Planctomycetaceae bacterium]